MHGVCWIICVSQGGKWWPRQDLPPVLDEEIAKRYAKEQTRMSGQKHEARAYAAK